MDISHVQLQVEVMERWDCWYWTDGWDRMGRRGWIGLVPLRGGLLEDAYV